jgi:hypothetical protein
MSIEQHQTLLRYGQCFVCTMLPALQYKDDLSRHTVLLLSLVSYGIVYLSFGDLTVSYNITVSFLNLILLGPVR